MQKADFAGPWEPAWLVMHLCRLIEQPTTQHGGTRFPGQYRQIAVFAGSWESATRRHEPVSPVTRTQWLMIWPTVKNGGIHLPWQYRHKAGFTGSWKPTTRRWKRALLVTRTPWLMKWLTAQHGVPVRSVRTGSKHQSYWYSYYWFIYFLHFLHRNLNFICSILWSPIMQINRDSTLLSGGATVQDSKIFTIFCLAHPINIHIWRCHCTRF